MCIRDRPQSNVPVAPGTSAHLLRARPWGQACHRYTTNKFDSLIFCSPVQQFCARPWLVLFAMTFAVLASYNSLVIIHLERFQFHQFYLFTFIVTTFLFISVSNFIMHLSPFTITIFNNKHNKQIHNYPKAQRSRTVFWSSLNTWPATLGFLARLALN